MGVDYVQQVLHAPVTATGAGIFTKQNHPLCADPEGFGPISKLRYDFVSSTSLMLCLLSLLMEHPI